MEIFIFLFTKQATLMRRSTVLSLPPQLVFPALSIIYIDKVFVDRDSLLRLPPSPPPPSKKLWDCTYRFRVILNAVTAVWRNADNVKGDILVTPGQNQFICDSGYPS